MSYSVHLTFQENIAGEWSRSYEILKEQLVLEIKKRKEISVKTFAAVKGFWIGILWIAHCF